MKSKSIQILTGTFLVALIGIFLMSFTVQEKKPWDIPDKYKKMENPYKGDKSLKVPGKMLWSKHCKSCHGSKGLGDGPMAKQLKTDAGDFSSATFQALTDGEIYYMSIIGRDEMPNYEKKIPSEEDRWAVVNYIRTMAK